MTVLRDGLDRPLPPKDIAEALARVDDRLELLYVAYPHRDYANTNRNEQWAIIERWTQNEPRRVMIQRGQMAETSDFDVLCTLPVDCDVEQAFGYFERAVKGQVKDRRDLERMVSRVGLFNKKVTADVKAAVTEYAHEMIDANATTMFKDEKGKIAKVYQTK